MSKNRREYYREYKARQRQARASEGQCIECGRPLGLEDQHIPRGLSGRRIGRNAAAMVMGKMLDQTYRCAACREKALARLRRAHPLPAEVSDPKALRRLLRRAQEGLRVWQQTQVVESKAPGESRAEQLHRIRVACGRWRGIIRDLEFQHLGLKLDAHVRKRPAKKR